MTIKFIKTKKTRKKIAIKEHNPGNHDEGETPVPIPNTEVKPLGADGTARAAWWESRKLPGFFINDNASHYFKYANDNKGTGQIASQDKDAAVLYFGFKFKGAKV